MNWRPQLVEEVDPEELEDDIGEKLDALIEEVREVKKLLKYKLPKSGVISIVDTKTERRKR